jgi:hypothetical protein
MFHTGILIAGMSSVFLFYVFLVDSKGGMIIALLIAIAMNGFAYWNDDKVVFADVRCQGSQPQFRAGILRNL